MSFPTIKVKLGSADKLPETEESNYLSGLLVEAAKNQKTKPWFVTATVIVALIGLVFAGIGIMGLLQANHMIHLPKGLAHSIGTIGSTPDAWGLWFMTIGGGALGVGTIAIVIYALWKANKADLIDTEHASESILDNEDLNKLRNEERTFLKAMLGLVRENERLKDHYEFLHKNIKKERFTDIELIELEATKHMVVLQDKHGKLICSKKVNESDLKLLIETLKKIYTYVDLREINTDPSHVQDNSADDDRSYIEDSAGSSSENDNKPTNPNLASALAKNQPLDDKNAGEEASLGNNITNFEQVVSEPKDPSSSLNNESSSKSLEDQGHTVNNPAPPSSSAEQLTHEGPTLEELKNKLNALLGNGGTSSCDDIRFSGSFAKSDSSDDFMKKVRRDDAKEEASENNETNSGKIIARWIYDPSSVLEESRPAGISEEHWRLMNEMWGTTLSDEIPERGYKPANLKKLLGGSRRCILIEFAESSPGQPFEERYGIAISTGREKIKFPLKQISFETAMSLLNSLKQNAHFTICEEELNELKKDFDLLDEPRPTGIQDIDWQLMKTMMNYKHSNLPIDYQATLDLPRTCTLILFSAEIESSSEKANYGIAIRTQADNIKFSMKTTLDNAKNWLNILRDNAHYTICETENIKEKETILDKAVEGIGNATTKGAQILRKGAKHIGDGAKHLKDKVQRKKGAATGQSQPPSISNEDWDFLNEMLGLPLCSDFASLTYTPPKDEKKYSKLLGKKGCAAFTLGKSIALKHFIVMKNKHDTINFTCKLLTHEQATRLLTILIKCDYKVHLNELHKTKSSDVTDDLNAPKNEFGLGIEDIRPQSISDGDWKFLNEKLGQYQNNYPSMVGVYETKECYEKILKETGTFVSFSFITTIHDEYYIKERGAIKVATQSDIDNKYGVAIRNKNNSLRFSFKMTQKEAERLVKILRGPVGFTECQFSIAND